MGKLSNDAGLSIPAIALMLAIGSALVTAAWQIRGHICDLRVAQLEQGCDDASTRAPKGKARSS